MIRFLNFIRDHHSSIQKGSYFLIAVVFIVFIFPREGKFKYEFQKGKPWQHEELIAPFNFPIYKTAGEIQDEEAMIKQLHKNYFFKNRNVLSEELTHFQSNFQLAWLKLEEGSAELKTQQFYDDFGQELLSEIYDKGIIELHTTIEGQDEEYEVMVMENNIAEPTAINQLYTVRSAFQYVKNSISQFSTVEEAMLLEALENCLRQNIHYDEETNKLVLSEELKKISPSVGMIQKGERIISKGDLLSEENFKILVSLKNEYESQLGESSNFSFILVGQIILVTLLMFSLALFFFHFRKEIINSDRKLIFILFLLVLFVFGSKLILNIENVHYYFIPFCILPLVIRTFFDIRVALISFLVCVLIVGFIIPNPYEFIIIQMITGMLTLMSVRSLRNRSQLFLSALLVFIIYAIVYLSIGLIQNGNFDLTDWKFLGWFFGSAMLTLLAYPLIYLFEKIFGFVSDVTLMELSDSNNRLLRKLNEKAPGTFQHSLQVANLAEEAIRAIGGNPLLVRTGALYHDVGKMNMPNYFIENQNSDYNPHDELAPEESAQIIIDHVINGIEIARRYNLPDIIVDFIRTHHGTTTTRFFYKKYLEEHPEEEIDVDQFKYPGPKPYSKETAVLLMADSVEAASRSLKNYDGVSIEKLIDSIIQNQIAEKQFENANITFRDISTIKSIFKKKLKSIYHVRVEYPD